MTHQCLIASYPRDYAFLIHCLASLKKFSKGFLHPVVVVHYDDWKSARAIADQSYPEAEVKVYDGVVGQGFLRAQICMMSGDIFCPEADFTWLLGSDCFCTREFTPEPFFKGGKPVMLYTDYRDLAAIPGALQWRGGVESALGLRPQYEFMRRLPLIYPRELFAPMRQHIAARHNVTFLKYVEWCGSRKPFDTSESNWLGAFAHRYMPDLYEWVDTAKGEHWDNPCIQFWSHGSLDGKCDHDAVLPDGSRTAGRTPRDVIDSVLRG